jgi:2,4-dienoyl-CoA reductase-like NADH-dependent reductase (Old Yellow Enzyme family)
LTIRKIASLKTVSDFQNHLQHLGIELPVDEELHSAPDSPLAKPLKAQGLAIGNRFAILPMEGWDGTTDGFPTPFTIRRWQRFGLSGAKLIWGGEAVAVRPDGRANPNQLMINADTVEELSRLRQSLVDYHRSSSAHVGDLIIGLQLTHSGRYARPLDKKALEPRIAYDHPYLNPRVGLPIPSGRVLTDDEIEELVQDFIHAAKLAWQAGFDFVDVKHCHGYLGHEFLSAVERPGKYGGSLENRSRFAREIITGIQSMVPGLKIGVRLSAFDFQPFRMGEDGVGVPQQVAIPYPYAFGGDGSGLGIDLTEPIALLRMLQSMGVNLFCITAGSPYYNPHVQRPAFYPPSDGYHPPEDPLVGVARQVTVTNQLKAAIPGAVVVGSAYSYLQEWLPHVAQAVVRCNMVDMVGLGRMVLTYPEMPLDILAGRPLQTKRLCRTFSDCTTGPRNNLVSGCYPLDHYYKELPEAKVLAEIKKNRR